MTERSDERRAREITRLVDAGAAADAPTDSEARRQVEAQRRVVQGLRTGGPELPDHLEASVRSRVQEAYGSARPSRGGGLGRAAAWRPALAVAAVAACAAIVLVALGVGSGRSAPSIPAAARLADAPSTGPAPSVSSARYLDVSYGGVTYPNYGRFAVSATGRRTDRIGGRSALTVFYRLRDGTRLSYTVFSGRPVRRPASARPVVYQGVPLHVFRTRDGLSVVTLVRFGRTCVLAARTAPSVVLGLAAAPVREQAA
jgi:hypothetical protein